MKISIASIMAAGCDHIWHDLIPLGNLAGDTLTVEDRMAQPIISRCPNELVYLTDEKITRPAVNITVRGHDDAVIKAKAIPYDQWPMVLRLLVGAGRKPSDAGLGDMVERLIGPIGGDKFKEWHRKIFGKDCGCGKRKETLNQLYSFDQINESTQ